MKIVKCDVCRGRARLYDVEYKRVNDCDLCQGQGCVPDPNITPAEALYGFAGWITCFEESVTAGARNDSAIWAHLVNEFCKTNNLSAPRMDVYPDNFTMPTTRKILGKDSEATVDSDNSHEDGSNLDDHGVSG